MLSRSAAISRSFFASTRQTGPSSISRSRLAIASRGLKTSLALREPSQPPEQDPTKISSGEFAGTDDSIRIRYPGHGFLREERPEGDAGSHYSRTLSSFSLEGKVCVITGGARGLGYTIAQGFMESGAEVALVDLNGTAAQESAEELRQWFANHDVEASQRHSSTSGWGCDVSSEDSVKQTFKDIIAKHGKIDCLVTSAGFVENFAAQDYPIERVRKLNSVNIDGTFMCAQAVARHLMDTKRRGSMIFIGSMSGNIVNIPQPQAPYNASKAAVKQLAASCAVEWSQYARVNTISPGYMLTALTKKILDENTELKRTWEGLTPMGRMGQPEELKGAAVFLASDASSFVTGAELRVDGGYCCT